MVSSGPATFILQDAMDRVFEAKDLIEDDPPAATQLAEDAFRQANHVTWRIGTGDYSEQHRKTAEQIKDAAIAIRNQTGIPFHPMAGLGTHDNCSYSGLAALAEEILVHYAMQPYDEIRPLSYDELLKSRTRGRWSHRPDLAKKYVDSRRRYEGAYRTALRRAGLPQDPQRSFAYLTVLGKHLIQWAGDDYEHRIPLVKEYMREAFFDVVGLPRAAGKIPPPADLLGKKGLDRALRLWKKYKAQMKPGKFMDMTIDPRIEVFTQKTLPVEEIWKSGQKLDKIKAMGLGSKLGYTDLRDWFRRATNAFRRSTMLAERAKSPAQVMEAYRVFQLGAKSLTRAMEDAQGTTMTKIEFNAMNRTLDLGRKTFGIIKRMQAGLNGMGAAVIAFSPLMPRPYKVHQMTKRARQEGLTDPDKARDTVLDAFMLAKLVAQSPIDAREYQQIKDLIEHDIPATAVDISRSEYQAGQRWRQTTPEGGEAEFV